MTWHNPAIFCFIDVDGYHKGTYTVPTLSTYYNSTVAICRTARPISFQASSISRQYSILSQLFENLSAGNIDTGIYLSRYPGR
jgi:hypothetical protein